MDDDEQRCRIDPLGAQALPSPAMFFCRWLERGGIPLGCVGFYQWRVTQGLQAGAEQTQRGSAEMFVRARRQCLCQEWGTETRSKAGAARNPCQVDQGGDPPGLETQI